MRAVQLVDAAQRPSLIQQEVHRPAPRASELLIRVNAAGVILTELSWYPTHHNRAGATRLNAVPAHEFSGVVVAVGEDVGSLEIGREVYGMNDWYAEGALADYCVAPFHAVAPKPRGLTATEAASVPISALTAWQGLLERAKLQSGETVLIHGGAGSVGAFAVQLARMRGARVIATASARNLEFVSALGAEHVIDYHQSRFEERVARVDVVFDTVGGETLERSWGVLKPNGRMVTVAAAAENSTDPRVKEAFFIVEPNQKQLYKIASLLENGRLRTVVDTVVPLSRAPELFSENVPRRHRGKIVVAIQNVD